MFFYVLSLLLAFVSGTAGLPAAMVATLLGALVVMQLIQDLQARQTAELLRPPTLTGPERETVWWGNQLLGKFWVAAMDEEMVTWMRDGLLASLRAGQPDFVADIEVNRFDVGGRPPVIDAVSHHETGDEDSMALDLDLAYFGDFNLLLTAKVGARVMPISLPIVLKDVIVTGRLRIELPLIARWPWFRTIKIAFVEQPRVNYTLKPLKIINVTEVPMLKDWLEDTLNESVLAWYTLPRTFDMPWEIPYPGWPEIPKFHAATQTLVDDLYEAARLSQNPIGDHDYDSESGHRASFLGVINEDGDDSSSGHGGSGAGRDRSFSAYDLEHAGEDDGGDETAVMSADMEVVEDSRDFHNFKHLTEVSWVKAVDISGAASASGRRGSLDSFVSHDDSVSTTSGHHDGGGSIGGGSATERSEEVQALEQRVEELEDDALDQLPAIVKRVRFLNPNNPSDVRAYQATQRELQAHISSVETTLAVIETDLYEYKAYHQAHRLSSFVARRNEKKRIAALRSRVEQLRELWRSYTSEFREL